MLRKKSTGHPDISKQPEIQKDQEQGPCRKGTLIYQRLSLLSLVIVFILVAHNICWLNPFLHRPIVFLPIPYGWEYNKDSGLEIYSAIDFPEGMIREKCRINRPLKNAVLSGLIDLVELVCPLTRASKMHLSYALHHAMNFALMVFIIVVLYRTGLRAGIKPEGIFVIWFWFLFTVLLAMATSHTDLFQVASPTLLLWALIRLLALDDRRGRVFLYLLYAVLCGFTVLIKQQYAWYIAVTAFAFLTRRWLLGAVWLVAFHLPMLFYRLDLYIMGVKWYNHEAEVYGQGVWWLTSLRDSGLVGTLKGGFALLNASQEAFLSYYGIVVLGLAIVGVVFQAGENVLRRRLGLLLILVIGSNFLQTIAANRPRAYMFGDSFPLIALFFSHGYEVMLRIYSKYEKCIRLLAAVFLLIHASIVVLSLVNLPWISPWDQLKR